MHSLQKNFSNHYYVCSYDLQLLQWIHPWQGYEGWRKALPWDSLCLLRVQNKLNEHWSLLKEWETLLRGGLQGQVCTQMCQMQSVHHTGIKLEWVFIRGVLKWSRIESIRNMFWLDSYKSILYILFNCFHQIESN